MPSSIMMTSMAKSVFLTRYSCPSERSCALSAHAPKTTFERAAILLLLSLVLKSLNEGNNTSKSSTGKLFRCGAPTAGGLSSPLLLVHLKIPAPTSVANDISQQDHRTAQLFVVESSYDSLYHTSRIANYWRVVYENKIVDRPLLVQYISC
eukprot:scaffold18931_cov62-Attheya_sp.AAC.7